MAEYELNASVRNSYSSTLTFKYYCKGKDDNPNGKGTERGRLYHGEMLSYSSTIEPGATGSFKAKSVGSTIQGTIVYETQDLEEVWFYFHVPDIRPRHAQSPNVTISINSDKNHSSVAYEVSETAVRCYSTIYKVSNIIETFERIKNGKNDKHKAKKFNLRVLDRAPGSGNSADLIAHQQGAYKIDGTGNFLITGSAKGHPGYFYLCINGDSFFDQSGKDYTSIDLVMTHPGGIQVAEDILVVGNEQYDGMTTRGDRSNIRFYDIRFPEKIRLLDHLQLERRGEGKIASAIGLTKIRNQWLLAVRAAKTMDFYTLAGDPKYLTSRFNELSSIKLEKYNLKDFQCVNLFVDENEDVYLFGMPDGSITTDQCWMYRLNTSKEEGAITAIRGATEVGTTTHFHRNGDGPRFKWGSCIYFEPNTNSSSEQAVTGEFKVFSIAGHVVDRRILCNEWNADL